MVPNLLSNVQVQEGNAQVLVSWDLSVGATSYSIMRSLDQVTYVEVGPAATTQFLDTTVTVGVQYWYKAAGINGTGTGAYSAPQNIIPTLPGEMSLAGIRQLSKQKADRVNSQFITDPEWNTYINNSYFELYDLLVQKYGNDYFVEHVEFPTNGTNTHPLPNGINYDAARPLYKLLGMDMALNPTTNAWITLKAYTFIRRNDYVYPQITTNLGMGAPQYRLVGSNIQFIPTPSAGQTMRMWYIPRMQQLLQDTDIVDGISGWAEYIAIDAAIKALQKEESDVTVLAAQKVMMIQRIEAAAENRDAGEPQTISDTRGATGWGWGDGRGPTGGV